MMYVIYNNDGSIKYKLLNEFVVQGNNNVNELFVAIEGREDYSLYATFKLPNGSTTTVVSSTPTTEFIEGLGTFTGRKILLSNAETLVAGALQMNVICLDENDAKIVAFNTYITVNETGIQLSDPVLLTVQEYENLISEIEAKMSYPTKYVQVTTLPDNPDLDTIYVLKGEDDLNEVFMFNGKTESWIPLGSNRINLSNYYTKEEGEDFEEGIEDRVSQVESELSSVASGSPKGIYPTLADLQAAYPTGTSGIYVVNADGHWYYWSGSAWTDGGVYLSTGDAVPETRTIAGINLENDITSDTLANAINKSLRAIFDDIYVSFEHTKNLFDKNDIISGQYWDEYGNIVNSPTLYSSALIKVKPNTTYYINPSYGQKITFWDDNGDFISSSTSTVGTGRFTTPNVECYCRFYGLLANLDTDMLCEGEYPNEYIAYGYTKDISYFKENLLKNIQYVDGNILNGKKIAQMGDSITWYDGNEYPNHTIAKGYASYLREAGAIVDNYGVSGAGWAALGVTLDMPEKVDTIDFTDYDYCTMAAGINDFQYLNSPLGTILPIGSAFDKETFTGGMQYTIEKILSQNKSIKLSIWTPIKSTASLNNAINTQNLTLNDYCNRLKEVAKLYSIPVIDLNEQSGINGVNLSTLTIDGLHLNNDGYKKVCENLILGLLKTI